MSKPYKLPAALAKKINASVKKWIPYINETPGLLSLLYDIDLMPEQIGHIMDVNPRAAPVNCTRMVAFCMLWKGGRAAFGAREATP